MIKKLHINNYALFKNVEIDFTNGFTVISGDTGAGKSIMLDALSLVLGKRVDRFAESSATQKSIIEAEFLLNDSHKKFFNDNDIDFDKETIIRREISINGKSRAFINDTPVLLNVLTQFSHQIVEIFSQHEKLVFKDPKAQFIFLDEVADSNDLLLKYSLDAFIGLTRNPAWEIDYVGGDNAGMEDQMSFGNGAYAAIAGYPHLTVPLASINGLPVGISVIGTAWSDAKIMQIGYTLEANKDKF